MPLRHAGPVNAVAFSPGGKTVLTGSDDNTARLWNVATGKSIGMPLRHAGSVNAVAFSPDGKTVLTGSLMDKKAQLWDVATGKPIGEPLGRENPVNAVAFSPDGNTVLTGSDDNTARLWSVATGKSIGVPLTHENSVYAVAFSPDGNTVLTATQFLLHLYSVYEDVIKYEATCLHDYPLAYKNAPIISYHFQDPSGNRIQIATKVTDNSVMIVEVDSNILNTSPIYGDPNTLLDEWQRKLALQINQEGKIVPMFVFASEQPLQKGERDSLKQR